MQQKPEFATVVDPRLEELKQQWQDLEDTTKNKGEKLFDANRHVLYEQSCDDIDGWINEIESQIVTEDVGHDLTTVNLLVQKQNVSSGSSCLEKGENIHILCKAGRKLAQN